jgi:RHS repeat-associated protein
MQPSDQNGTVRQDVRWMNVSNVDINRFKYGFSRASNRLWRQNTMTTGFDEQYIYDNLYQVNERLQGTLSGGVITGTPVEEEQFTLDPTGNWSGYAISGDTTLSQTRTHQEANEISAISPSGSTGYDDNGNMTTMPKVDTWGTAQTVTYDAWNRPITIKQGGTTLGTYQYDGLNRRIWKQSVEGSTLTTRHFYYSKDWQVLEERASGSSSSSSSSSSGSGSGGADRQYVWGTRYVDDLVLRDLFEGTTTRYYALADYFQPTAIANTSGVVEERYVYRAFGDVSYYNGSFSSISSSAYDWTYLYGSYPIDLETNLYPVRYRYYHSALGRWLTRDPFVDKKGNDAELIQGANLYWYVSNNAVNAVDPTGLQVVVYVPMHSQKSSGSNSGSGEGDPSDLADLLGSVLSTLSFNWAQQNGEKGCGSHTQHPECNCCVIVLNYTSFGDNDLYDWKSASGHLENKSCDDASAEVGMTASPPAGSEQTINYEPW